MSRVGSPSTATRSASRPGATRPSRSSRWKIFALPLVAARRAASGVMPYSTISLQLAHVVAVGEDADVAAEADRHARLERRLEAGALGDAAPAVGASRPLTQPSK